MWPAICFRIKAEQWVAIGITHCEECTERNPCRIDSVIVNFFTFNFTDKNRLSEIDLDYIVGYTGRSKLASSVSSVNLDICKHIVVCVTIIEHCLCSLGRLCSRSDNRTINDLTCFIIDRSHYVGI